MMNVSVHFLIRFFPIRFRKKIKDIVECFPRVNPGRHEGLPKYKLKPTQVYPKGKNLIPTLIAATERKLSLLNIKENTPITSIGSCFAEEFSFFMKKKGFNYICAENDSLGSSANWGRVYTIINLLQIVRYSIDEGYPVIVEKTKYGYFDPLRESTPLFYKNREQAVDSIIVHRRASYEAFSNCEILIITLGQNEAWLDYAISKAWVRIPPEDIKEAREKDFSVTEFSYEENVKYLKEVIDLLKSVNPDIKIIFTISPVASYASFTDDDVISKSFANKCLLRTVVNELVENNKEFLFYFPSFEIVLCDNPKNYRADNRHVKHSAVDRIFHALNSSAFLN